MSPRRPRGQTYPQRLQTVKSTRLGIEAALAILAKENEFKSQSEPLFVTQSANYNNLHQPKSTQRKTINTRYSKTGKKTTTEVTNYIDQHGQRHVTAKKISPSDVLTKFGGGQHTWLQHYANTIFYPPVVKNKSRVEDCTIVRRNFGGSVLSSRNNVEPCV